MDANEKYSDKGFTEITYEYAAKCLNMLLYDLCAQKDSYIVRDFRKAGILNPQQIINIRNNFKNIIQADDDINVSAKQKSSNVEQLQSLQATLTSVEKRLKEIDKLVVSTYEDKVKGAIPEAICVQLMRRYEDERLDKLEQKTELIAKAEALKQSETEADDWIDMIRDYLYARLSKNTSTSSTVTLNTI